MARTWPSSTGYRCSLRTLWARDHTLSGQALEGGGRGDAQQASDGNSTLGDDHFLAFSGSCQPLAQVCSEVADRDVHPSSVQLEPEPE